MHIHIKVAECKQGQHGPLQVDQFIPVMYWQHQDQQCACNDLDTDQYQQGNAVMCGQADNKADPPKETEKNQKRQDYAGKNKKMQGPAALLDFFDFS